MAADLPYGVILGELDNPSALVGIRFRPTGGSVRRWMAKLRLEGCSLSVSKAASYPAWFLSCAGTGECERRDRGRCPLEDDASEDAHG